MGKGFKVNEQSHDFQAAYVEAELELKKLNRTFMVIWAVGTIVVLAFVVSYLWFQVDESIGFKLLISAVIAIGGTACTAGLGHIASKQKNRTEMLPILAARLGLDGSSRGATAYNRDRMFSSRVMCKATIADKQDRYLVQLIVAAPPGDDTDKEFEGIALRASCSEHKPDIMIRRTGTLDRVLNWFSRGNWEYSDVLNAKARHPRFGIYTRRDVSVSMSDYLAFAETIERVHKAADLGSGFEGAYRKGGWVTLLIDGSPVKWVNVGSMFDGPSARAQRTKQALAEIGELAGGAQLLWRGFNDQSSE